MGKAKQPMVWRVRFEKLDNFRQEPKGFFLFEEGV